MMISRFTRGVGVVVLVVSACGSGDAADTAPSGSGSTASDTSRPPTTLDAGSASPSDGEDPGPSRPAPTGDDEATAEATEDPPGSLDPVGVALIDGVSDEVVAARDHLAEALGIRPAFDAVASAMARGYDGDQIVEAAGTRTLGTDGTIDGPDGPVTPAGPAAAQPLGVRSVPRAPIEDDVLDLLWDEITDLGDERTGDANEPAAPPPPDDPTVDVDGAATGPVPVVEWTPLRKLELIIAFAQGGLPIEDVVGYALFGITIDCTGFDSDQRFLVGLVEACTPGGDAEPSETSEPSTTPPVTTLVSPPDDTDPADDAPDGEGGSFVGSVDLAIGIESPTILRNELVLVDTAAGLSGRFDYLAEGADGGGSYCVEFTATFDEAAVPLVEPGRYAGTISVTGRYGEGGCGAAAFTPFADLPLAIEAMLEGDQLVGTVSNDDGGGSFVATRGTPPS